MLFAVRGLGCFGLPAHKKQRMALRHREGKMANTVGLCLQRERHTKRMQDFLCTGIADLQHGLALLLRFGKIT